METIAAHNSEKEGRNMFSSAPGSVETKKEKTVAQTRQFCTFWLSGRLFGVQILDVKEIHPEVAITPIFHAPREVKGYVNIRGQVYLILDLRPMLGFESKEIDRKSCLVIFKTNVGESFGVLVDQIGDVVEISSDQIESGGGDGGVQDKMGSAGMVQSVCKLPQSLLVVLDARKFLGSLEIK